MKLYHLSDLHLGSAFIRLDADAARRRRAELLDTFRRVVRRATAEGVKHILLAGDIFDTDTVARADKNAFYDVVAATPAITFYYLRGNHDAERASDRTLQNLVTFSGGDWSYVDLGQGVRLAGREHSGRGDVCRGLSLRADDYNIVMLHGDESSIDFAALAAQNIDYLALGHIHTYSAEPLGTMGIRVYSGCLESRGFDEAGPKGFVRIDTERHTHEFVCADGRPAIRYDVDISSSADVDAAVDTVAEALPHWRDSNEFAGRFTDSDVMLQICLTGETDVDADEVAARIKEAYRHAFYIFDVKNDTRRCGAPVNPERWSRLIEALERELDNDGVCGERRQAILSTIITSLEEGDTAL